MNPGQQCTYTVHDDDHHEFYQPYEDDYARLRRECKPVPTRCSYVAPAVPVPVEHPETAYNARLKDPRVPRRDHYIEVEICNNRMNVAAATTYANRCGITVAQILQDHGYLHDIDESAHTD